MIVYCKFCNIKFTYGPYMPDDLRGLRTRKICDVCKLERKRAESREYQRKKRITCEL